MDLAILGIVVDASGAARAVDGFGDRLDSLAKKNDTVIDKISKSWKNLMAVAGIGLVLTKRRWRRRRWRSWKRRSRPRAAQQACP
jgi:hypothetical protein